MKEYFKQLREFIKKYVFFNVPKDEKQYIKNQTMMIDHQSFRVMLIIVAILQLAMIIYTFAVTNFNISGRKVWYMVCYSALAIMCIVALLISESLYKKKKQNGYFALVAIMVNVYFLWAAAITVLDCKGGSELTTFAYVSLALTCLVLLEPWIFIVDAVGFSVLIVVALNVMPDIQFKAGIVISSLSIAILTSICAIVNFSRRVIAMNLEKEVKSLNNILRDRAYIDDLTGIHNRRYLTERIDTPLNIGLSPSCVFMFDIDNFKMLNDQFGHQNGDICLISIGKIINDFISSINGSYAVRYGGEEFLIYISHLKEKDAFDLAEALRKTVDENPITLLDGSQIHITISVGVSVAKSGMNYSALINKADANSYIAKERGKNLVIFE